MRDNNFSVEGVVEHSHKFGWWVVVVVVVLIIMTSATDHFDTSSSPLPSYSYTIINNKIYTYAGIYIRRN